MPSLVQPNEKQVLITINAETWEAFKARAKGKGLLLKRAVQDLFEESIDTDTPPAA